MNNDFEKCGISKKILPIFNTVFFAISQDSKRQERDEKRQERGEKRQERGERQRSKKIKEKVPIRHLK